MCKLDSTDLIDCTILISTDIIARSTVVQGMLGVWGYGELVLVLYLHFILIAKTMTSINLMIVLARLKNCTTLYAEYNTSYSFDFDKQLCKLEKFRAGEIV